MPPPPVLKKRHTLKGKNLIPIIKRMKQCQLDEIQQLARLRINIPLESVNQGDLISAFRNLTGESEKDILEMAGREINEKSLLELLHVTIIHANEFGQSDGQDLLEETDDCPGAVPPPPKRQRDEKHENALEQRIKELEDQQKTQTDNAVDNLKEKVRHIALQMSPSIPLLLLCVDDLAKTARKYNHPETAVYEELARQATYNQEKIDIPTFCVNVLGGKASDLVGKALKKSMKPVEKEKNTSHTDAKTTEHQSPLMNLYNAPPGYGYSPSSPMFYPQMPYHRPGPRRYYRGSNRQQHRDAGNCLFCNASDHYVRDCIKMKAAKNK